MITPSNPIVIPAEAQLVADGLWISSLQIFAPTVTSKIKVLATIVPMVSSDGTLLNNKSKTLRIDDVAALSATDSSVATAMGAIFAAVQSQVTAQNLF